MEKGTKEDPGLSQQEIWNFQYQVNGRLWGNVPLEPTAGGTEGFFLDLGCGDGKNLRRCKSSSLRIGVDFSPAALRLCKQNPELADCSFICADVRYLPFKDNSIHWSDAHHIMDHFLKNDLECAAADISRVLVPAGEVVVTIFGSEDLRCGTGTKVQERTFLKGTGILTHYFTYDEVSHMFPCLVNLSIDPYQWSMRVKGKDLQRHMWVAKYQKPVLDDIQTCDV